MSYKDLEEARAKRDAKDQAAATKGKRSRKPKAPAAEEGEAKAGPSMPRRRAVPSNATQPARATELSWRAPVAKIY
jgi:hypothetical protein